MTLLSFLEGRTEQLMQVVIILLSVITLGALVAHFSDPRRAADVLRGGNLRLVGLALGALPALMARRPEGLSRQLTRRSEVLVGEHTVTLWADTVEELFAEAARVDHPAALLADGLNEFLGRLEIRWRANGEVGNLRRTGRLSRLGSFAPAGSRNLSAQVSAPSGGNTERDRKVG